jgi:hypothetical protein
VSTNPKVALTRRLHTEGRYAEYVARREQLKLEGAPEHLAWIYAAAQFPPMDGSPLEVRVPGPLGTGTENENVTGAGESLPTAAELNGDIAAFLAAADPRTEGDRAFDKLHARVAENRKASTVENLEWVYENAATSFDGLDPAGVPSRGALRLLKLVQSSDRQYGEFLLGLWSKIIPAKSSLDSERRFTDDGRKRLVLMEEFEADFAAAVGGPR